MTSGSGNILLRTVLEPASPFVRTLRLAAFLSLSIAAWSRPLAFAPLLACFLFFEAFRIWRFYGWRRPRRGIEDHFARIATLCLWLYGFFGGVAWVLDSYWPVFGALPLFLAFALINVTLLVFHVRDNDGMEPNAFSGASRVL